MSFAAAIPGIGLAGNAARLARLGDEGLEIIGKVGTVGPQPTQLSVHPDIVEEKIAQLLAGEKLPPIEIVRLPDGREFILDGHHRYVASQLTGVPVEVRVFPNAGPTGLDWSEVVYERFLRE